MNTTGSVTHLLGKLRSTEAVERDHAAAAIWKEYCAVLLDLACQHLDRRLRRRVDADDIVQHTFKSFFLRQRCGQFDLADRSDLLNLLMRMTMNKVRGAAAKESRKKRDYRRDSTNSSSVDEPGKTGDWVLAQIEHGMPSPVEAAALAEEAERALAQLPDDLRQIALYKLEGFTSEEIAALPSMGCSVRKVERKLRLIREAWERAN